MRRSEDRASGREEDSPEQEEEETSRRENREEIGWEEGGEQAGDEQGHGEDREMRDPGRGPGHVQEEERIVVQGAQEQPSPAPPNRSLGWLRPLLS